MKKFTLPRLSLARLTVKCEFCKIGLPLIVVLVVGFYTAWQFVPSAASHTLKIAIGSLSGPYNDFALQYQQNVKAEGIQLDIVPLGSSVEALKQLQAGQVDLALVQGGAASSLKQTNAEQDLRSIASLFYEPLWGFYRKELGTVNHLSDLRGKRLAIGPEGSGTQLLLSKLLTDNAITPENTTLLNLKQPEAEAKLAAGEIDAAFILTLPTTDVVVKMSANSALALLDFQRQALTYTSRYLFLSSVTLGEGMMDLKENIPDHNITLLATTAALVTRSSLHTDHVRLFSREAIKLHSKPGLLEKPRQFPSIDFLELPIHPTAEQYIQNGPSWLEKIFPFWLAARLDQLKIMLIPLLTLLIPLSKGIMPLYKWRIRSRIYPWYKTLSQLDRKLDTLDLATTNQEIAHLQKLHAELAHGVSVPLGHMPEFYTLRTHADHILTRLKEHRAELLETTTPESTTASKTFPKVVLANATLNPAEAAALVAPAISLNASPSAVDAISTPITFAELTPPPPQLNAHTQEPKEPVIAHNNVEPNQVASTETIDAPEADTTKPTLSSRFKMRPVWKKNKHTDSKVQGESVDLEHQESEVKHETEAAATTTLPDSGLSKLYRWKRSVKPQPIDANEVKQASNTAETLENHSPKANVSTPSTHRFRWPSLRKPVVDNPLTHEAPISAKLPVEQQETKIDHSETPSVNSNQHHRQAQKLVRKHMLAGMVMSAIPVPLLDVATLTSTQLHLLNQLSQHYAVNFDKKLAKAKLLSLLSSTLPTTTIMGLSSLTKLVPGIGTLGGGASLSVLTGATIYATGSLFIRHFEEGGTLETFDDQQHKAAFRQAFNQQLANPTKENVAA